MQDTRYLEMKHMKGERQTRRRRIKKTKRNLLCFIILVFIIFTCTNIIKSTGNLLDKNINHNKSQGIKHNLKADDYVGLQDLNEVENVKENLVVVLDAGHGGVDVGTSFDSIEEKNINMQITNKFKKRLEDKGIEVILTRAKDETMTLSERTEISNSHKPDLFLSIHCNFYEKDSSISGFEAYYFNNEIAKKYADRMLKEVSRAEYIKTRNVKSADYYVLKNAKVPAILLELGFLSNEQERRNLSDDKYQDYIVNAMAIGVIKALDPK